MVPPACRRQGPGAADLIPVSMLRPAAWKLRISNRTTPYGVGGNPLAVIKPVTLVYSVSIHREQLFLSTTGTGTRGISYSAAQTI